MMLTPPLPLGVAMAAIVSTSSCKLVGVIAPSPGRLDCAALDSAVDNILLAHR